MGGQRSVVSYRAIKQSRLGMPLLMRDPDGYLIEVGQYTQIALDWFKNHS